MANGYVMVDGGLSEPEDDFDMWGDHEEWCCLAYEDHGCPCTCHVIPVTGDAASDGERGF